MRNDQFDALSELLRLKRGATNDALRLHMVGGLSIPDAARQTGASYRAVWMAAARVKRGLDLARRCAGSDGLT